MNNFFLNVDTLQEVKVLTSGNSAEYASPVVMDFVTQSGANSLHGRFLMQLGNPALSALGPNATKRGLVANQPRPAVVRFRPVWIPQIYNGRTKLLLPGSLLAEHTTTTKERPHHDCARGHARRGLFVPAAGTFQAGALRNPAGGRPFRITGFPPA